MVAVLILNFDSVSFDPPADEMVRLWNPEHQSWCPLLLNKSNHRV